MIGFGLAQASTQTIDFQSNEIGLYQNEVLSSGFRFSNDAQFRIDSISYWDDKHLSLGPGASAPGASGSNMAKIDGGAFSLDYLEVADVFGGSVTSMLVTGTKASGGSVTTTISGIEEVYFSTPEGVTTNILAITFDAQWSNLIEVNFSPNQQGVVGLDNIVVTAVPIPAAAWLFGSALAALGWIRRKQIV